MTNCPANSSPQTDEYAARPFNAYSPQELDSIVDNGFKINRSLWDREARIADLAVEVWKRCRITF